MRFLSLGVLACALVALVFVGCGEKQDFAEVDVGDFPKIGFKVGILTGTVSQGEDEYRGAERVTARYGPKQIVHRTYPDNFMTEQETTVTQLMEMARDPDVKAIIVAQAVPGTLPAIKKARRERDDLIFILVSPQEDPEQVTQYADLILTTDDLKRGETIVAGAKKMGATTFVHYTFPRHMSMEILSRRRDIMREQCKKLGLEWVQRNSPDPTGDQGIAGSQKFILEDVPRAIARYGKDTAFFSTNCAMQEPLIQAALNGGAIFVEQCCPSPTHGYPGALGIIINEDIAGDMKKIREQIGKKVAAAGMSGRFATWATSMHIVMIEAGIELARGKIAGELDLTDVAAVKKHLEEAGGVEVGIELFNENPNYMLVIADTEPF
jgi:hypothetical protein